jgi:hypothetical protein
VTLQTVVAQWYTRLENLGERAAYDVKGPKEVCSGQF